MRLAASRILPKLHRQDHNSVISLGPGNKAKGSDSGETDPVGSARDRQTGGMSGSGVFAFSEPDEFASTLAETSSAALLVVGRGAFHARMTRITLAHLRLSSVQEQLPRIAFVAPPAGTVRVYVPLRSSPPFPVYGGMPVEAGTIVIHAAGNGAYERLDGPGHWGDILLPTTFLARYCRAVAGVPLAISAGAHRWRPPRNALLSLTQLHAAAVRVTQRRPGITPGVEAVRGLEQELTGALIECLAGNAMDVGSASGRRHAELMARFAAMARTECEGRLSASEIAAALGVSDRTLRTCCRLHLNMGPSHYLHAHRMQLARRALRVAGPSETSVTQIARRFGFSELGRFAASYRARFGELPSATLKG
jgi:AraC-like DNA-binding protein